MSKGISQPLDEHDEPVSLDDLHNSNDASAPQVEGECFDPSSCCDARDQVMIAAMKAYLRPQQAPECLYERLKMTLDKCCGEVITEHTVVTSHTIIHHTHRQGL